MPSLEKQHDVVLGHLVNLSRLGEVIAHVVFCSKAATSSKTINALSKSFALYNSMASQTCLILASTALLRVVVHLLLLGTRTVVTTCTFALKRRALFILLELTCRRPYRSSFQVMSPLLFLIAYITCPYDSAPQTSSPNDALTASILSPT